MKKQYFPPSADYITVDGNDAITASLAMPTGLRTYKQIRFFKQKIFTKKRFEKIFYTKPQNNDKIN